MVFKMVNQHLYSASRAAGQHLVNAFQLWSNRRAERITSSHLCLETAISLRKDQSKITKFGVASYRGNAWVLGNSTLLCWFALLECAFIDVFYIVSKCYNAMRNQPTCSVTVRDLWRRRFWWGEQMTGGVVDVDDDAELALGERGGRLLLIFSRSSTTGKLYDDTFRPEGVMVLLFVARL